MRGSSLQRQPPTIGAEPKPDSFENKPRAQPDCKATMMPEPTAPPNAAFDVNAHSKIIASAGPTYCQLIARITMQPPKYAMAMNGTSFSATLEMDFTPPKITSATAMAITSAIAQSGTPGKLDSMMPVMAADCTAEPVPMVAITAKAANATAPSLAHQGRCRQAA